MVGESAMLRVTLLLVLLLSLARSACADPAAETNRLVRQLGSSSFAKREAATKALRALGEKALPALKQAATSPDAEVRRRATQLLRPLEAKVRMQAIEEIKQSQLTPREKGRRLKAFITMGMTGKEVEAILGGCSRCTSASTTTWKKASAYYEEYELWVHYQGDWAALRVASVELQKKTP
jgi:hypothetical protein